MPIVNNTCRIMDYLEIKPVYHIGFIDFTLFENHPEFFAKYQIRNAKDNPSLNSTAENIFRSNSDEQIRELCRRREDQIAHENYQKNLINKLSSENEQLSSEIEKLKKLLEEKNIHID